MKAKGVGAIEKGKEGEMTYRKEGDIEEETQREGRRDCIAR